MAGNNLTARLRMDGSGFAAGVTKAKAQVASLRARMSAMAGSMIAQFGLLAVAAVSAMQIKASIEWGTRMRDLADQFGVSTDAVQKLDYAFKQTGGDAETAFKAIKKMMIRAALATNDLTSKMTRDVVLDAFQRLGVSMDDLKTKDPSEMFMKIAKNMQGANVNSAALQESIQMIFGKNSSQLFVTFQNDLEGMMDRLVELGAVVDEEAIRRLGMIGDKMEEFKTQNRSVWADITVFFAEGWMGFVNFFTSSIDVISEKLVSFQSAIMAMGAAAKAAMTGNIAETNKQIALMQKHLDDIGGGSVLGAGKILTDIGDRMNQKEKKLARGIEGQQKLDAEKKLNDSILEIKKEQGEALEAIDKLEDKAEKRRFKNLSPERQLLELTQKRKEEQEKLNELAKPMSKELSDIINQLDGLEGVELATAQADQAAQEQAYLEQQVITGEAMDKEKALKDKLGAKGAAPVAMSGGIAETYTTLSKIGGQLGAKNPLIEQAKMQIKLAKSSDQYLANISQVTTETFKG